MLRHAALFVAIVQLYLFSALGAMTEVPVKGNEKILISVPEAVIHVQGTSQGSSAKTLKINLNEGASEDYMIRMEGSVIRIEPKEASQNGFLVKPAAKKRSIEISGPSVQLEIHAFEGQIQLAKWSKEALLHLQKGRILSREGAATLIAHSQSGEIQILDHQGRVEVDAYRSAVIVKNLNGDADLENFSGETNVDKTRGFLSLNQGQGNTKITASSGTLQFEVSKGILNVQSFQGRVEGQTQEGPVNVSMASEGEVNIRSQNGRVTVHTPADSGAFLNLTSVEGDIQVPNYLRVVREGSQKALKGRLKGSTQKGSVVVRSQEGAIVIR